MLTWVVTLWIAALALRWHSAGRLLAGGRPLGWPLMRGADSRVLAPLGVMSVVVALWISEGACAQVPRTEPQVAGLSNLGRFVIGSGDHVRRGMVQLENKDGVRRLVVGLSPGGDPRGVGGVVELTPEHRVVRFVCGPGIVVSGSGSGRSFLDVVDFANGPVLRRIHEEEGEEDIVALDYNHRERALYLLSHSHRDIVRLPLQGAFPAVVESVGDITRLAMPEAWEPGMDVELMTFSWPDVEYGCAQGGYLVVRDLRRGLLMNWRLSHGDDDLRLRRLPRSDLDYVPERAWRLDLEAGPKGGLLVGGVMPTRGHLLRWHPYGAHDVDRVANRRIATFNLSDTNPLVLLDGEALEQYRGRWLSVEGVSLSASRPVYVPWQFGGDVNSELLRLRFEAVPFAHPYPDCARYQVAFRLAPDHRAKEQPLAFLLIAAIVKLDGANPERVRSVLRDGGASAAFAPPGAFEYSGAWFDIKVPADARVGEHIACQVHALQVRGGSYEHIASSEVVAAEIVSPPPKGSVLKEQEIGVGLSLSTPMEAQMRDLLAMLRWR